MVTTLSLLTASDVGEVTVSGETVQIVGVGVNEGLCDIYFLLTLGLLVFSGLLKPAHKY